MNVRRVVTGHNASGKSVFVSDEAVEPTQPSMMPTVAFHLLWGGDTTPQFPDDGSMPEWSSYFPPIGGFRFGLVTLAPGAEQPDVNVEDGLADLEEKLPGLVHYMDPSDPGMHTTDTIDFEVVLEGTITLELDDGAEVALRPGDTVVQNGTRHRWKNAGDSVARFAVFICGASHAGIPPG
jgi:mannose-6-phosphate isomerase-like protein (cupin superfamily)